ncbi:MAG: DUF5996 family protein, partial [Bacteroidales bacterium]|nr:DUF5996 family protein [Bacteroidales bacterium]
PTAATWVDSNGSPMAFLRYENVRTAPDPRKDVLNFLESAYKAGASLAAWNMEELKTPLLKDL